MTTLAAPPRWDRASLAVVVGLCAVKALVHLALVNRYGYHGDELYFIECGRHLALGYVDHPPLLPWIARLADQLAGSLVALRLPAIAAGTGTMVVAALLVREWGGGWRAQLLALLCLLVAPANLRIAAMLDIPVVEVFLSTLTAYFVARALARGERWTWLLAGGALGLAILAKHSSLFWGGALAIGILATPGRRVLASRWPWFGVAVAFLFVVPNLLWQVANGFPTLEFMSTLRHDVLAEQGRGLFAAGQLLYFHPLAVPVWIAGLAAAFSDRGRAVRPFALLFLGLFACYLAMGGKPYYLASAYPAVLVAGGIALEEWLAMRVAALNVLREEAVPRAVSGHMTYYLWGPDGERGEVLIAYGLPRTIFERHYRTCTESGHIDAPLARPGDTDLPVYVCREPLKTMAELWPELRRFGHLTALR